MQCSKCGSPVFITDSVNLCPACAHPFIADRMPLTTVAEKPGCVAWERMEDIGFIPAFLTTLRDSIIRPKTFFERVGASNNTFMAFLYGLTIGSIGSLFNFVWTYYLLTAVLMFIPGLDDFTGKNAATVAGLIFTPVLISFKLAFMTLYFHILLMLTRSSSQDSRGTFRIMCYVQSASVLDCIPILGTVIAPVWSLYLIAVAFNKVHHMSKAKAWIIILLPLIIILVCVIVLLIGLVSVGIVFQDVLKELLGLIRY